MKTFNEWIEKNHPEYFDEGILQDLGKNKFVRNAVTAAGLGAAALGGYGMRSMQGRSGVDSADRPVATASDQSKGDEVDWDQVPGRGYGPKGDHSVLPGQPGSGYVGPPIRTRDQNARMMASRRVASRSASDQSKGDEVDWDQVPGRGYGPKGDHSVLPGQPGSGYVGPPIRTRDQNARMMASRRVE